MDSQIGAHASEDSVAREDRSFSKIMVIVCCFMWVALAVVYFAFKFSNPNGSIDSTFIACWFTAWGAELVMLSSIKKSRIKNKYERE